MAGRYDDEREWRERELQRRSADRYDAFGLNDEGDRYAGREDRTFDRHERVFGEQESGVAYNRPQRGAPEAPSRGGAGWQDANYTGVSPAMRRGDYETSYRAGPRSAGSGYGPRSYGSHGGYDREGHRFGSHEADQRWAREMRRPPSGYENARGHDDDRDSGIDLEERAREAGEFFRRTGRRITNWFSDVAGEGSPDRGYGEDRQAYDAYRGARGRGPKGYQRSDERINEDVHHHLTDDRWLDASDIDVSVSNGDVTLSGTVGSRDAKHRAERIVEDLSGVKHVQNNIRVQATGYGSYAQSAGTTGSRYGAQDTVAAATSEQVKDVTDGATNPSAMKRN